MTEKVNPNRIRKKSGRPALFTDTQIDKIVRSYNDGMSQMDLAICYKCSLSTIRRILKQRSEVE